MAQRARRSESQGSDTSLLKNLAKHRATIEEMENLLAYSNPRDISSSTIQIIEKDLVAIISDVRSLRKNPEISHYLSDPDDLLKYLTNARRELQSALYYMDKPDVQTVEQMFRSLASCEQSLSSALELFQNLSSSSPTEQESGSTSTPQPSQPLPPASPEVIMKPELDEMGLFHRLSPSSHQALNEAYGITLASGQEEIHMEHLIVGLLAKKEGPAEELLGRANIHMATLGEVVQVTFPPVGAYKLTELTTLPKLSEHVRRALVAARDAADLYASETVRTRHLLYGALSITDCHIIQALLTRGIRKEDINLATPPLERADAIHPIISGFNSDTPDGPDLLGIKKEVEALCSVLAAKDIQPPLSLGLFGDWGTGKSFFMRMMQERIEKLKQAAQVAGGETTYCRDIVQLKFNAWHYIDTDLWASLTSEIFQGLARSLAKKEDIDSEYKRARLLVNTIKAKDELVKAQQEKNEADVQLQESQLRLKQMEHDEATIEASLSPQAIIQGAWRFALRQPEVREAIQKTNEVFEAKMRDAANELHYSETDASKDELKTELLELRGIGGTVKALLMAIRNAGDRRARLRLVVGIAIFLLVLAGALIPLVFYRSYLIGVISSFAGVLIGVLVFIAPLLPHVKKALSYIKGAQEEYDHLIEEARKQKKEQLQPKYEELRREVDNAQKRLENAQLHLEKVSTAVKDNEQAMEELRPHRQMLDFIKQRQASTVYSKHLGVIAQAREDFEKLSILLAKEQEDADQGTPADQEGKLLPRIDRIILYIDDLDRCPENQVVDVLQAVHLLLAFPLFIVVVGVDSRWLLQSLKQHSRAFHGKVSKQDGIPDEELTHWQTTPLNYLEKIFQIPFALRPMQTTGFERLVDSLASQQKSTRPSRVLNQQIVDKEEADGKMQPVLQENKSTPDISRPETNVQLATPSPMLSNEPADLKLLASASPQEDIDLNPAFLQVEEWEKIMMKKLYRFIPSPRAAKRFINVYRLLKASVDDQKLQAFIGDENGGQHRSMLLLLAMLIGYPAETTEILRSLLERNPSETWWGFIDSFKSRAVSSVSEMNGIPHSHGSETEIELWRQLLAKLTEVKPLIPEEQSCADFVECAPLVARYSYQSAPVLFA